MDSQDFFGVQPALDAPRPLPPPHKGEGRRAFAALFALALAACGPQQEAQEPLTVLAAASLTEALEEIGADFADETGTEVRFSFASSSTLARQIEAGAPAGVFASANDEWMDYLEERELIVAGSRVSPIGNALVLVAPADSPLTEVSIDPDLDVLALLGPEGRISLGDPSNVPAGQYAQQAFEALGLWDAVEPRVASALDVRGALVLVERGEAPLGVVYATDAGVSEDVKVVGVFPETSHDPIAYPFALVAGHDTPEAEAFLAYATGENGLAVFGRYGFTRE